MSDIFSQIATIVPKFDELRAFSEARLFHQLIEGSFSVVDESKISPELALNYFNQIIKPIGQKLNPVRFTELTGLVLKKSFVNKENSSLEKKCEFLDTNFKPFDATGYLDSKDPDVKMTDSSGPSTTTGASSSSSNNKGNMSHYSKAAYSDFLDAKMLYLSFKCTVLVEFNEIEKAKECMDDLTAELFGGSSDSNSSSKESSKKRPLVAIGAKVFSWYYSAQMTLYEATKDPSKYYRAGVNYFLYTPLETAQRDYPKLEHLAIKLGFAALIAPGEFNFGELLELSLFKTLPEIKSSWIYALIFSFQEGSYELYDTAKQKFQSVIDEACRTISPQFSPKKDLIIEGLVYEKFCACVLIEYAFRQPKSQRKLSLSKLKELIRVDDIETLLINSMCAGLVRGEIDQVEGSFTYTWVRPRVLDLPRLEVLENRVDEWILHQKGVLSRIEEMTPELLVTV